MPEFIVISLLNGISFGAVLFLLAAGLSLALGLMGLLNLAHGSLFMFGAFVGWTVAVQLGFNFWLGVLAGGAVAGLIGLAIERGILQHLYRLPNEQALATIGFLYILTNVALWIWGGGTRTSYTMPALAHSIPIGNRVYPLSHISVIVVGVVLAIFLWWFQEKTRFGTIIRAGIDDKEMVEGLGVNLGRVNYLLFFLAAGLAGAGGVIGSQILAPDLSMSMDILLLGLIVLVVGGVGSIQGAFAGSMLIGLINAFGVALFPEFARFFMYVVMIIVLLVRPTGLLGKSGLA